MFEEIEIFHQQERSRIERNRLRHHNSVPEPEYDVVDDHEEELNVRILPARPIHDEADYADRDLPRSSSAQSLTSLSTRNVSRENPPFGVRKPPPAVNRDLKPGKRKTRSDWRPPQVQAVEQRTHRHNTPPSPFLSELVSVLPGLGLQDSASSSSSRDGLGPPRPRGFSPHSSGQQSGESVPASNRRRALDLETHDIETRLQQNHRRASSKRQHHEWPQTKEDIINDFVTVGKPQQVFCEEDWYVGACNRNDAEHALHLVNKDGAFLVRDCSINSKSEPLVLAVYHDKKVYNVKIRFIESRSKFTLGNRQRSNDMFDSVADIIKFHSIFPLVLISGRNLPPSRYQDSCVLTCPITKSDVDQLLQ